MADYGIKIAKPGFSVHDILTEQNKKNYTILSSEEAHKIIFAGYITGGSYEHNLTYEPFFDAWEVDSTTNPTYFKPLANDPFGVRTTPTHIQNLTDPAYIVIYNEGNK